jgi:hypothetical protein
LRHESIQIDDMGDRFRQLIGNAGYDHSAGAITDQDNVTQVFELQEVDDICDMNVKSDFRAREMRAFAEPGEGRSVNIIPARS